MIQRKLQPGVYDIQVVDGSVAGRPSVRLDALEIPAGQIVEKKAEFFSGKLTITATLGGEPIATPVKVFGPDGEKVFSNWTNYPRNGTRIVNLPAATYTVEVKRVSDNTTKRFENITIEAGREKTLEAAF